MANLSTGITDFFCIHAEFLSGNRQCNAHVDLSHKDTTQKLSFRFGKLILNLFPLILVVFSNLLCLCQNGGILRQLQFFSKTNLFEGF